MSTGSTPATSARALRAEIAQHRQELALTVDQLAAKLDVRARARARARDLRPYAPAAVSGVLVLTVVRRRRRRRRA